MAEAAKGKNIVFALTLLLFTICACGREDALPELKTNRVIICRPSDNAELYDGVKVFVAGKLLPLYKVKVNTSQVWNGSVFDRIDCPVGFFDLDGRAEIKVELDEDIDYSSKVRPLSAGIVPVADIENRILSFTIKSAGHYVIEPNGDKDRAIMLFVSEIKEEPPPHGSIIRFKKGIHDKTNSSLIGSDDTVYIGSNTTVILEEGAIVRAKFKSNHEKNIRIIGKGIIDGSQFERNADTGQVAVPVDFGHCEDVELRDFSVFDPAGWCVNFYFINNALIDNVKIITSRSNGDGISIQSCKNVTVNGAFVRSWDDSLVVKNYPLWHDKSIEGETENITFKNCTIWTDLAQSMEIGYETIGKKLKNVRFENITVLHNFHKPLISIHNANNADIEQILFKDITVEDARMGLGDSGPNSQLIEIANVYSAIWSEVHKTTSLGSISDVTVENLLVKGGRRNIPISVKGCVDMRPAYAGNIHKISGVLLKNINIRGTPVTDEYKYLEINDYVENVSVVYDGTVSGARFLFAKTEEELKGYGTKTEVEVI